MYEVKIDSPLVEIKAVAVKVHKTPGLKSYKMEFHHADGTVTQAEHRFDVHGILSYASDVLKCYPDAAFTIDNEVEDPIKKTLPPTKIALLAKTAQWSNRLGDLVKKAWEDGVYLEIHRHKPTINKDTLPVDWVDYHVSTPVGMSTSPYVNAPERVDAVSIGKHILRPGDTKDSQYQYLGQYFPNREQNPAVISEIALLAGHPLDHGNMKYDPTMVVSMPIDNPSGKVLNVEPRNPTTPLHVKGTIEKLQHGTSEATGFQKTLDATVADTGGYISKVVEGPISSEVTDVDNSPTATKVK